LPGSLSRFAGLLSLLSHAGMKWWVWTVPAVCVALDDAAPHQTTKFGIHRMERRLSHVCKFRHGKNHLAVLGLWSAKKFCHSKVFMEDKPAKSDSGPSRGPLCPAPGIYLLGHG
jgi:hypothetical protein